MFNDKQVLVGVFSLVAAFIFFLVVGEVKREMSFVGSGHVAEHTTSQEKA